MWRRSFLLSLRRPHYVHHGALCVAVARQTRCVNVMLTVTPAIACWSAAGWGLPLSTGGARHGTRRCRAHHRYWRVRGELSSPPTASSAPTRCLMCLSTALLFFVGFLFGDSSSVAFLNPT